LRFLIVGAGAVGGLIAARLTDAGYDVTVLALPRSAARLREGGLRIASGDGTRVLRPAVVTAGELTSGPCPVDSGSRGRCSPKRRPRRPPAATPFPPGSCA